LIAFIDCDDEWTPHKLNVQRPLLVDGVSIVLGFTQRVVGDKGDMHPVEAPLLAPSLGAALMTRSVFDRLGVFDEHQTYADDVDWLMRAREAGEGIVVHRDLVLLDRRHAANMTNQTDVGAAFALAMVRKSLARRRAVSGTATALPKLSGGAAAELPRDLGAAPRLAERDGPDEGPAETRPEVSTENTT
jgi:hypothetical protein